MEATERANIGNMLPSLSYVSTASNTSSVPFSLGKFVTQGTSPQMLPWTQPLYEPITYQQKETTKPMARLIRYTVVDPNVTLAEKAPELCILDSGLVVLNGTEDRGFLMDLAPKLSEKLEGHNTRRVGVEHEDKDGELHHLKPIKLSQLDVVIEVIKEY